MRYCPVLHKLKNLFLFKIKRLGFSPISLSLNTKFVCNDFHRFLCHVEFWLSSSCSGPYLILTSLQLTLSFSRLTNRSQLRFKSDLLGKNALSIKLPNGSNRFLSPSMTCITPDFWAIP